jgi:O-antigen biosynthesis protein WbqL
MSDLERPQQVSRPPSDARAETCVVTLFEGGASLDEALLLWREALPEHLVREHEAALATPPLEVFCIADALLHGPGWVSTDDKVLFEESLYPTYCREMYQRRQIHNSVDRDLGKLTERRFKAGWHVTHFNCGVYGHWLLEVMPKLLAIEEFLRRWPEYDSMPIFMPSIFRPFVYRHIRSLLPQVPIVTYDPRLEYIQADAVYMPTWGQSHVWNSWIGAQVDALDSTPAPAMPKRLFVSRRLPSTYRVLDNREELEQIAVAEGLTAVRPDEHSLSTQIALFRNAELVAGEFGSALHNALFSPRDTLVIALNWVNACQSRIARFRRHRIGYVLPASGSEVVFAPDAGVQKYAIDPDEFRAKLREAIERV